MPRTRISFLESNLVNYFLDELNDVLFEDKDYIDGYRACIMDFCHYFNIDNSKILIGAKNV